MDGTYFQETKVLKRVAPAIEPPKFSTDVDEGG